MGGEGSSGIMGAMREDSTMGRGAGMERGEKYQEQFRGGEASGRGVWSREGTGERIEGQYKAGMLSGEAVWERPDKGVRIEGVFKRGHAHGPGTVTWPATGYK